MKIDFKNQTIIITGGTRGIGRGIAESMLACDAEVIITGHSGRPSWCRDYQACSYLDLDLSCQGSIDTFLTEIQSLEKIDVLINNAGIQKRASIDSICLQDWERVVAVNLNGPMKITRAIAPKMKKFKKGKILNISSVAGLISKPEQDSYSATKAGLIGLTRSAALDLAPHNILVNALCPGTTETEMVKEILTEEQRQSIIEAVPMGRFAAVSEIANVALFLCSDWNTYITGQTIVVDGGFTAC